MYVCPTHQTEQESYCASCMAEFKNRRPAAEMTGDERAAEVKRLVGIVTMPFDNIHARMEEIVGRAVYTHEMGSRASVDQLMEEARTQQHITFAEIIEKIPDGKATIVAINETN